MISFIFLGFPIVPTTTHAVCSKSFFTSCDRGGETYRLVFKIASSQMKMTNCTTMSSWTLCRCVLRYLALVVSGGDVHLLLHHVIDVGGGAALDPFLLLPLQLVSHHLDGLCPLIPKRHTNTQTHSQHQPSPLSDMSVRPQACTKKHSFLRQVLQHFRSHFRSCANTMLQNKEENTLYSATFKVSFPVKLSTCGL